MFAYLPDNMSSAYKLEIKTWNGTGNFYLWRQKMRALLLQQRCVATLDNTWAAEISAYRRRELDDTAWNTVFLHLSGSVIRKVGETTSVEALWTKLESLYLTKSMANKCYLLRQFYNFRFDPSSGLEEHLDKLTKMIQDLDNCDEEISNDQQVVALSNSLSERYRDIRNSLEYGGQELTVNIVTSALRNKELELKVESKDS